MPGGVQSTDTPATAIQVAAGESELLSGVELSVLRAEIADSLGGVPANYLVAPVTPKTIGVNPPSYVYSLGVSNTLIAAKPESVSFNSTYDFNNLNVLTSSATVVGFNPATDILQVSRQQAAKLSDLTIYSSKTSAGAGTSVTTSRANIDLLNVTPDALHASNFSFV